MKKRNGLAMKVAAVVLILAMVAATIMIGLKAVSGGTNASSSKLSSSEETSSVEQVSIHVTNKLGETVFSGSVEVVDDSVLSATKRALDGSGVPYVEASGKITSIGGEESTEEEGWIYYIGGEPSQVSPATLILKNGSQVEWKWGNFVEVYGASSVAEEDSSSSNAVVVQ